MRKDIDEGKDQEYGGAGPALSINKKKSSRREEEKDGGGSGGFLSGFKTGFFKW